MNNKLINSSVTTALANLLAVSGIPQSLHAAPPSNATTGGKSPRVVQSLDRDWRFHLGVAPDATAPDYDDSGWRQVDVPHDYVVEGMFVPEDPTVNKGGRADWFWLHGFLPVQPAVYRKELSIPASAKGKSLWLEFDGVFNNSRYWLNGREVYSQYSGYTRARFNITKAANIGGGNTLVVEVDPRYEGWWYEGGGIYRHARMVTLDPIHIAPDGVFVMPHVHNPGDGIKADADIKIHTDLTNTNDAPSKATIRSEILNAKGKVLATKSSTQNLVAGADAKVTQSVPLPSTTLWSPETPYLYRLRSTVIVSGKIVDQVTTNFGVRHIRFDAKRGLFLNGKHVKLKGVNIHQDHAGVGVAVPDRLFTWRLERLKEMGCNAIRLSHNPVTPFLLDECDRMGFLVMAENRNMGDVYVDQTPKDAPAVEHRELSALVKRDRNHPSIFSWSLCNEQWISGTPESGAMVQAMKKRVLELDSTRPITAALNGGFDTPEGIIGQIDIIGINYNPWVYDAVHEKFPDVPIIASEIASEVGTRGIYATEPWEDYYGDRERGYVSAYSITAGPAGQTVEKAWPPVASRDNIAGGFVWAGFDYKGEPRPFGWPVINCHYGFFDICGFPKDSYYYYKSWWSDEPVLHVFPHWNWSGKEGEEITVWVHSNCDEVELFLNAQSLGRKKMPKQSHLEWKVKYAPGTLLAHGFKDGKEVLTDKVETTDQPVTVKLTPDRTKLAADGTDVAVVTVQVADEKGRPVPTVNLPVEFAISGPGKIIGVGNGDPSSHEPDQFVATKDTPSPKWSRSLFNGLAQVIIQSQRGGSGNLVLHATAAGLKPAETTISVTGTPLPSSVPVISASPHEIYVSPAGADDQPGTSKAPVRSLEAARKLARARAGKEPVTITVEDGVYYLDKPLVLTSEDSGSRTAPVIYRAAHEGKAILSGGIRLQLHWEPYQNGIFKAKTPPGLHFDQLFVNGNRQIMARYPNYDPTKKDVPYRGASADAISPERIAKWADPTGGYIHAMHPSLWGGFEYLITGKETDGTLHYEGGWQNNRPAGMHPQFRMVENIFEELDAPGEWFHDHKTNTLYFYPPADVNLTRATVEGVRLSSLVEFQGSQEKPVCFVTFNGFTMRHTARTFLLNKEPLLRSDWTIYRGGTVFFNGAEDCNLLNTFIDQPGGNAVFVNNYNRRVKLSGLHIFDCGASAVAFVGDPNAVRNPLFRYEAPNDFKTIDRTPGALTDNYPMECTLEDSLLHEIGTVEKQGAGVQISMSRRITVRHCSIYDTSRAGINVNEGTWGGHIIEGCDVFRTVQETGDHGSFNSWGRDRFWVPNTADTAVEVDKNPNLPFLDAIEPNILRNNRWRCDHGWDIDLDDGSTNYIITNNVLLHGGLKLREGYKRIVTNNILVNNTLHPHVWYPNSGDVFTGNVIMAAYRPAVMQQGKWGSEIDRNLFASNYQDSIRFAENGADTHSVVGDPQFAFPAHGDFTVKNKKLAQKIGFKNFPMSHFGVQKASLKAVAETPVMPQVTMQIVTPPVKSADTATQTVWLKMTLREPKEEEFSAYGVSFDTKGVAIEEIDAMSPLGGTQGLQKGDLLLEMNGTRIRTLEDFRKKLGGITDGILQLRIVRHQKEIMLKLKVDHLNPSGSS